MPFRAAFLLILSLGAALAACKFGANYDNPIDAGTGALGSSCDPDGTGQPCENGTVCAGNTCSTPCNPGSGPPCPSGQACIQFTNQTQNSQLTFYACSSGQPDGGSPPPPDGSPPFDSSMPPTDSSPPPPPGSPVPCSDGGLCTQPTGACCGTPGFLTCAAPGTGACNGMVDMECFDGTDCQQNPSLVCCANTGGPPTSRCQTACAPGTQVELCQTAGAPCQYPTGTCGSFACPPSCRCPLYCGGGMPPSWTCF